MQQWADHWLSNRSTRILPSDYSHCLHSRSHGTKVRAPGSTTVEVSAHMCASHANYLSLKHKRPAELRKRMRNNTLLWSKVLQKPQSIRTGKSKPRPLLFHEFRFSFAFVFGTEMYHNFSSHLAIAVVDSLPIAASFPRYHSALSPAPQQLSRFLQPIPLPLSLIPSSTRLATKPDIKTQEN